PPRSTLFPYTTLFRSRPGDGVDLCRAALLRLLRLRGGLVPGPLLGRRALGDLDLLDGPVGRGHRDGGVRADLGLTVGGNDGEFHRGRVAADPAGFFPTRTGARHGEEEAYRRQSDPETASRRKCSALHSCDLQSVPVLVRQTWFRRDRTRGSAEKFREKSKKGLGRVSRFRHAPGP